MEVQQGMTSKDFREVMRLKVPEELDQQSCVLGIDAHCQVLTAMALKVLIIIYLVLLQFCVVLDDGPLVPELKGDVRQGLAN